MKLFRKLLITITLLTIFTLSGYSQDIQSFDGIQHFNVENRDIANVFMNISVAGIDGNFEDKWKFKGKIEELSEDRFEIALSKPIDKVTGKQAKFLVMQVEFVRKEEKYGEEVYRYRPISSRGNFNNEVRFIWTNRNLHLGSLGYDTVMGLGNIQSIILIHFQLN